jgi:hypothetical protein
MRAAAIVLASLAFAHTPALAQGSGAAPRISNGRLDTQAAGSNLTATVQRLMAAQAEPAWIGYTVAASNDSNRRMCCGDTWISDGVVIVNGRVAGCGLEQGVRGTESTGQSTPAAPQGPVHLEGPDTMVVLLRVADKSVDRVRVFSPDCELDAGGRAVHWLDGVTAPESIALLTSLVTGVDRVRGGALAALAMHRDDVAVPALLRLARQDPNSKVRGDALFWLGQSAGRKVAGDISSAIENDPDTDVKKRAVFALSQLPKDEGVPLLINVAKTNQNPAVRKQAMFWLGQSKDPRALDFFAQILSK